MANKAESKNVLSAQTALFSYSDLLQLEDCSRDMAKIRAGLESIIYMVAQKESGSQLHEVYRAAQKAAISASACFTRQMGLLDKILSRMYSSWFRSCSSSETL